MKRANLIGFIAVLITLSCSINTWAGEKYYKNFSIKIYNPDTAKGRVYVLPYNETDTAFCTVSEDPAVAGIDGYLSNVDNKFKVNILAIPEDGYVLSYISSLEAYNNGTYLIDYISGSDKDYALTSTSATFNSDTTTHCIRNRPTKGANLSPKYVSELCAIFTPAKRTAVRNPGPGKIADAIKNCRHGDAVNDLKVTGPIAGDDLKYLNKLSQEKGLTRLDLSGALFSEIPDSAFYESGLYELKLPPYIQTVGNKAFCNSIGLKPIKFPARTAKSFSSLTGCILMQQLDPQIKAQIDAAESKDYNDKFVDFLLGEYPYY